MLAGALAFGGVPGVVLAAPAMAASSSCVGGSVNFAAHQDDDLLFQSPDILGDVDSGRCSRTVYVTAGDAGNSDAYWQGREAGSEAAWADMAGVANTWSTSTITAGGKSIRVRTLTARPSISLAFLRLPDGNLWGDGFTSDGNVSMYKLVTGAISSMTAKDGSASYTYSSLSNTMLDLLRASSPTIVRTQNYNGVYTTGGNSFDHWDHVAVARVAQGVSNAYSSEASHRRIAYVDYPTQYMSANVSGSLLDAKSSAFNAYCDHDDDCDPNLYYDYYGWPARQYIADSVGAAAVASAGADQNVLLNTTVTLNATGSYGSGSMSYAWSQTSGPSVSLSNASSAQPTFVPTSAGTYVFKVTVNSGGATSTDSVTVQASGIGTGNLARLAGVSITASSAATGQPATAAADGSTLGYPADSTKEWATVGGKAGSWLKLAFPQAITTDRVVLYDRPNLDDQITGCTLTFSDGSTVTCPTALGNAGGATTVSFPSRVTTSIQLTITGVSSTTQNIGLAEIEVVGATSTAPVANAGTTQNVTVNTLTTLNGSASTGSGTLSYAWAQTSGPATVSLAGANTAKPTFTPTVAGSYAFKLTVTANGVSSTSNVVVQVTAVSTNNVARLSGVVATASSGATGQTADRVIDGSTLGYPTDSTKEWASVGQGAGAWVQLAFPQKVKTDTVVLYDRPNANDQVLSGTLTFSDGSTVKVAGPLDNTGGAYTVTFPARVTSSVKFTVDSVSGTTENVGLAELQVLGSVAQVPVANAGTAKTVAAGTQVVLDGSASSDASGLPLTYSWAQTAGTSVTLTGATTSKPTFTPTAAGTYTFALTVSNGVATSTSSVTVTVTSVNRAPVANAGTSKTVAPGAVVTLDGSGSSDPDGNALTYLWTQTSPSSPLMALSSATAAKPTFTAGAAGTYVFQLQVSDGALTSVSSVTITVKANTAPVANAGAAKTVAAGTVATLDGSASTDPDGQSLTYSWVQTSGASVALTGATSAKPTFTPTSAGSYTFQLTVSDGSLTNSASVTVTVTTANSAPVANAGPDQSVSTGSQVTLNGSASSDPEGQALTYAWTPTTVATPVTLSSASAARPTFTPTTAGSYTFQLKVSDGSLTSTDTVTIVVGSANQPPVANAGTNQSVNKGVAVTLDASASRDPEGSALTYSWKQQSGPATVTLSSGTTARPTFTPTVTGSYVFRVTVSDGTLSSDALVTVTVANRAPVAAAGANQTAVSGALVTLNGSGSTDPDGDALTYSWKQTSGPSVVLSGATSAKPSFTASTTGSYAFQLQVSDGALTSTATVTVTVNADTAPVANAGAAQSVTAGATVTLNGSATDADSGQTLTYAWTQTSPASPVMTLSNAGTAKPTFTASTAGTYVFKLTVSDGSLTSTSSVTITVNPKSVVQPTNLAGTATVTASSQNASTGQTAAKAVDGSTLGYPVDATKEWATQGGLAGSWIQLTWSSPVTLSQIVLYDRPNTADRITSGTLVFSDGSTVPVSALDNAGAATTFNFTARKVTSVRLNITGVAATTENIGLAEFRALGVVG